jgi:hypothetical protein
MTTKQDDRPCGHLPDLNSYEPAAQYGDRTIWPLAAMPLFFIYDHQAASAESSK